MNIFDYSVSYVYDLFTCLDILLALGGRIHIVKAALEDLNASTFLGTLDTSTHSRLRQIELVSCLGDVFIEPHIIDVKGIIMIKKITHANYKYLKPLNNMSMVLHIYSL